MAYEHARANASAAAAVAEELRDMLIYDALEGQTPVRDITARLSVPVSAVRRVQLRRAGLFGAAPLDARATPEAYVAAHNAAWEHDPSQHIQRAPFRVHIADDGTRTVTMAPMGEQ